MIAYSGSRTASARYAWVNIMGTPNKVELVLAQIIIYNRKCIAQQSCDRHKVRTTIASAAYDDERVLQQACDSRTTIMGLHKTIIWFYVIVLVSPNACGCRNTIVRCAYDIKQGQTCRETGKIFWTCSKYSTTGFRRVYIVRCWNIVRWQ